MQPLYCGSSSVGRASAFQAECRQFEPGLPLKFLHNCKKLQKVFTAGVAQLVERQPSKLNVAGSNPVSRSNLHSVSNYTKSKSFTAGVAQLVERQPSKLNVASSNLVSRSKKPKQMFRFFYSL